MDGMVQGTQLRRGLSTPRRWAGSPQPFQAGVDRRSGDTCPNGRDCPGKVESESRPADRRSDSGFSPMGSAMIRAAGAAAKKDPVPSRRAHLQVDPRMTTLAATLQEVRQRVQRAGKKPLNEQNTKATLIEPVLRALGWDVEDIEAVVREFRLKSRDKPVDYGLTHHLVLTIEGRYQCAERHPPLAGSIWYSVGTVRELARTVIDDWRMIEFTLHVGVKVSDRSVFHDTKSRGGA